MNASQTRMSAWRRHLGHSPLTVGIRAIDDRLRRNRRAAAMIMASELPGAVAGRITEIVRRTRLRAVEQIDIARELVAHALDARDAQQDEPDILESLGDPKPVARLLRRATQRKRPLIYQIRRWALHAALVALGASVVLYAAIAFRFYTGSPSVRTDYLARLNAPILAAPESDKAWPVYQEALIEWYEIEARLLSVSHMDPNAQDPNLTYAGVESLPIILEQHPDRDVTIDAMKAYRPTLDRIARAARRPMVGMLLSPDTREIQIPGATRTLTVTTPPEGDAAHHPSLVETIIPHFRHTRHIAKMLAFDCNIAIEERDAQRAFQNLIALSDLADQIGAEPFLIGKLVGVAIHSFTLEQILRVYALAPGLFSREQTIELSRRLSESSFNNPTLELEHDRAMFLDILQRSFTDDGRGGGRLTPAGVRLVQTLTDAPLDFAILPDEAPWLIRSTVTAATPLAGASVVGRRRQLRKYDELLAEVQHAVAQGPHGMESFFNWSRSNFDTLRSGLLPRWSPLVELTPSYRRLITATMRVRSQSDAILVLLAADTYRIEHGAWPESLEPLVPHYLPRIPADPFVLDAPIRYRANATGPTIWYRGPDADDDAARRPSTKNDRGIGYWLRLRYEPGLGDSPDADAVMFPPDLD